MEKDKDEKHSSGPVVSLDRDVEKTTNPEKQADGSATAAEVVEPEHEFITGIKLSLVLASVVLVAFLMMLDMSIIVTVCFRDCVPQSPETIDHNWQAIPRITSDFHSLPDVGWYGSAYLLSRYADSFGYPQVHALIESLVPPCNH
jgi:hypothetical protein